MKTRSTGFTLIELMVVITIVAILASLAYSSARYARDRARISIAGQFQESTHRLLGADTISLWLLDGDIIDSWGYSDGTNNTGSFITEGVPTMPPRRAWKGVGHEIILSNTSLEISTISFWIRVEPENDTQDIISGVFPETGINIKMTNGRVIVSDQIMDTTINDGLWHHVTVTKQNGKFLFYLDGKRAGKSTSISQSGTLVNNLRVGPFTGELADIRIYSKSLE